mmetsp:Transcript_30969/g.50101  ORF Transcript_30969/g.50101 Transcript_30969/m.50101 type:complete len:345 (+) Transcript_30969:34-1068(+)
MKINRAHATRQEVKNRIMSTSGAFATVFVCATPVYRAPLRIVAISCNARKLSASRSPYVWNIRSRELHWQAVRSRELHWQAVGVSTKRVFSIVADDSYDSFLGIPSKQIEVPYWVDWLVGLDWGVFLAIGCWSLALWFGWREDMRTQDWLTESIYRSFKPSLKDLRPISPSINGEDENFDPVVSPPPPTDHSTPEVPDPSLVLLSRVLAVPVIVIAGGLTASGMDILLGTGWPLSTGILALVSALVYEIARPRRLTRDEFEKETRLWKDFQEFAEKRLEKSTGASEHSILIIGAFREAYGRYRTEDQVSDVAILRLVRRWAPKAQRTRAGFYKGVRLRKEVRPY